MNESNGGFSLGIPLIPKIPNGFYIRQISPPKTVDDIGALVAYISVEMSMECRSLMCQWFSTMERYGKPGKKKKYERTIP